MNQLFSRSLVLTGAAMAILAIHPASASTPEGTPFWLITLYSATAPAESSENTAAAETTVATMDQGSYQSKVSLIRNAQAGLFEEAESMVVQQLPMPSMKACEAAGSLIAEAFTLPSQMTIVRHVCVPGR